MFWVSLPGTKSYREHARNAGVDWQVFLRLLHNKVGQVDLITLQRLRDYLSEAGAAIKPGETRFYLGRILKERGLTQRGLAKGMGKSTEATVNRAVNNTLRRVSFRTMAEWGAYLELDSLEELFDSGGLLEWKRQWPD